MSRTYMAFTVPGVADEVEMGEVFAVPCAGDRVRVGGDEYLVARVEWDVYEYAPDNTWSAGDFPQQHATVVLKRRR